MYNKYYFLLAIIFFIFITYGQEPVKDYVQYEGGNSNKDCFYSQLMQNQQMNYDSRSTLLLVSPCWEQGVLDTTFCVLLFNFFLIDGCQEDLSEEIAFRLFNFFVKNPYCILQLNYFINLVEKSYQEKIFENVLTDLFYEIEVRKQYDEDDTKLSEIDFFRIFPYLFSNDNYIRIHNIIESYYEE